MRRAVQAGLLGATLSIPRPPWKRTVLFGSAKRSQHVPGATAVPDNAQAKATAAQEAAQGQAKPAASATATAPPSGPECVFEKPHSAPVLASDDAQSACMKGVTFTKLITQPLNFRQLQVVDADSLQTSFTMKNLLRVGWLVPTRQLQPILQKRYEVEAFAECNETGEPLGVLLMSCGHRVPTNKGAGWLTRNVLSLPHDAVHVSTLVVDRQHWTRTLWSLGSVCTDLSWGKFARFVYGYRGMVTNRNVRIDVDPPLNGGGASATFRCRVDGLFSITAKEEPLALFDTATRTVPGFSNNESAMAAMGVPTETLGLAEAVVKRQPLWSPPTNPQLAGNVELALDESPEAADMWYEMIGGPHPGRSRPPLFSWLDDEVAESFVFTPESLVEDEHERMRGAAISESGTTDRLASRSFGREQSFRDSVRRAAYSEAAGEQQPRE